MGKKAYGKATVGGGLVGKCKKHNQGEDRFWKQAKADTGGVQTKMVIYEYELGKASDILTRELLKLKPGETFVITADTESDAE
ncbi:unnamed protein product, partial [marine sediment metagenome]